MWHKYIFLYCIGAKVNISVLSLITAVQGPGLYFSLCLYTMLWRMLSSYTLLGNSYLTTWAQLSSSVDFSTFQKGMSLGWQVSQNPRQMATIHTQGSFVSSLEQVQHNWNPLKQLACAFWLTCTCSANLDSQWMHHHCTAHERCVRCLLLTHWICMPLAWGLLIRKKF